MKKDEAVESLERSGRTIGEVNTRIWQMALNPTQYGWGPSIASIVAIPVLSFASVGQLVTEAVVKQIPSDVFDQVSNIGRPPKKDGDAPG